MSINWQPISSDNLPPEGLPVHTRINDTAGPRNEAVLKRMNRLWFYPDGSMYVYYTPTEWGELTAEGRVELLKQADEVMRAAVERSETLKAAAMDK